MKNHRSLLVFSVVILVSLPNSEQAFSQTARKIEKPKMQEAKSATTTVTSKHNFLLYLPEDYDKKQSHPLMLFLHGAGERGEGNLDLVTVHGPPKMIKAGRKFPCVVVSPQCPTNGWWNAVELSALLDHVEANYKIDKKRIYLTGLSMGGYGVWSLALREPDRFAAIAPICGGGASQSIPYRNKISAPIWAFHGAKDTVIPLSELHEMAAALKNNGIEMKLTVYPEAEHDSWVQAYNDEQLYTWMFAHKRD